MAALKIFLGLGAETNIAAGPEIAAHLVRQWRRARHFRMCM